MNCNLSNVFHLCIIVQEKAKIFKWYINLHSIQEKRFSLLTFFPWLRWYKVNYIDPTEVKTSRDKLHLQAAIFKHVQSLNRNAFYPTN